MAVSSARGVDDMLEHCPAFFLPDRIAGDSVHVPYGFYSFRSTFMSEIPSHGEIGGSSYLRI